jgi:hypothetical protein
MRFRKLRIAWSVWWGIACVLLVVFWVRGYWRYQRHSLDVSIGEYSHSFVLRSYLNRLRIQYLCEKMRQAKWLIYETEDSEVDPWFAIDREWKYTLGFRHEWVDGGFDTVIPHWFAMCAFVALASAPWLRWHFSLRTLLIAMTLVAVLLGLIVFALRK